MRWSGFEVTPATVIGLLTILGFSLYDTVIVFDKVEENTKGFEHTTRRTFAEHANLAINQTFMRSINTSLISVLPIIALMVIAVWLLGVGTLKDLALVQLVGVIVGTLLVDLLRHPADGHACASAPTSSARTPGGCSTGASPPRPPSRCRIAEPDAVAASLTATPAPEKPAPGARPARPQASRTGRPSGKRNTRRR